MLNNDTSCLYVQNMATTPRPQSFAIFKFKFQKHGDEMTTTSTPLKITKIKKMTPKWRRAGYQPMSTPLTDLQNLTVYETRRRVGDPHLPSPPSTYSSLVRHLLHTFKRRYPFGCHDVALGMSMVPSLFCHSYFNNYL